MYQITAPKKYKYSDIILTSKNISQYFIHPSMRYANRVKERFADAVINPDPQKTDAQRVAWIAYTAWALAKVTAEGRLYKGDPLKAAAYMDRVAQRRLFTKDQCPLTLLDFEMIVLDALYRRRRPYAVF